MNLEERYEDLVDTFACNDDAVLEMARMIALLEWQVEDCKAELKDLMGEYWEEARRMRDSYERDCI